MKTSARKAMLSGLLMAAVLAGSLVAVTPAAAAGTSMTLESKSIGAPGVFTTTLTIDTDQYINAGQAALTFNKDMLQCNSVAWNKPNIDGLGGAFNNGFDIPSYLPGSASGLNLKIHNDTGVIDFIAAGSGGSGAPGDPHQGSVTGNFLMATFSWTALAASDDSIQTIVLDPTPVTGSQLSNQGVKVQSATLVNGVITIGTPQFADLTVVATTSGTDANYNLNITVTNSGSVAAGASTATYAIDGATAVNVPIGALAAGASQVVTPIALTVSGQSDSIVVTADAAGVIAEGLEGNNVANTSYSVMPDLVVSAASTTGTGTDPAFDLHFTIRNNGNFAAVASTATYTVGTGAAQPVAISALAAGTEQTVEVTGLSVPSGLSTTITITADSGFVVTESNDSNNTGSTVYAFTASNGGTTNVTGTIQKQFSFTVPTYINWNRTTDQALQTNPNDSTLIHGNNNWSLREMTVESNKKWNVTVEANPEAAGTDQAFMTKFHAGAYDTQVHLTSGLWIQSDPLEPDGVTTDWFLRHHANAQVLANGVSADLTNETETPAPYRGGTIWHYTRVMPVMFGQNILWSDPALADSDYYKVEVTFTCNVIDY